MKKSQFVNAKIDKNGKAIGEAGISRSTCYGDNKKLCNELKLSKISEKMCKSLGTR